MYAFPYPLMSRSLRNLADMSASTYSSTSSPSAELAHYNGLCTQVLRATQGALLTLLADALACPSTSTSCKSKWPMTRTKASGADAERTDGEKKEQMRAEKKLVAHATCRLFEEYVKLLFGAFVRPALESVTSFVRRGQEKASSASVTLSRLFRTSSTTNRVRCAARCLALLTDTYPS